MTLSQLHQVKIKHIAINDLLSDKDEPVSTLPNQSTNANHNIDQCNNEVNKTNMI